MDRACATQVKAHALQSIEHMSQVLDAIAGHTTDSEYEALKKTVGFAIGQIQSGILDPIYLQYPDLDDLK